MKIIRIDHLSVVVPSGRTPLRVVVSGRGRVRVDDVVLWSWRSLDRVIMVRAQANISVRVWGDQRTVALPLAPQTLQAPEPVAVILPMTTMNIPPFTVLLPTAVLPVMGPIDRHKLVPGELT